MKFNSWYYSRNLKPLGPISNAELREMILRGEVRPQDLICPHEEGHWRPAQEWGLFEKTLFPALQEFVPGLDTEKHIKEWVLLVQDAEKRLRQEGPLSLVDLQAGLVQRTIQPEQFVWKAGLTGWSRIADRPEFNGFEKI